MGIQPSSPKPGTHLQVIGAGLSRTGTASFSEALRILLDGPVYHGGTQTCTGLTPTVHIRSWIKILQPWPPTQQSDSQLINSTLRNLLDGYAAVTDAPGSGLVPELMAAYPDAKVICTVRDPAAWEKSMSPVADAAMQTFLVFILLPRPGMRYFTTYIDELLIQWRILYQDRSPWTARTHERHLE